MKARELADLLMKNPDMEVLMNLHSDFSCDVKRAIVQTVSDGGTEFKAIVLTAGYDEYTL